MIKTNKKCILSEQRYKRGWVYNAVGTISKRTLIKVKGNLESYENFSGC